MITEKIRCEMNEALKAGNRDRKNVHSAILDALLKFAKDKRGIISEQDEISVIRREKKQMEETLSYARQANNSELIAKCEAAISVMDEYLPQMMDESQIREAIDNVIMELNIEHPTNVDKGRIMKSLSGIRGKADMKTVSQLVHSICNE